MIQLNDFYTPNGNMLKSTNKQLPDVLGVGYEAEHQAMLNIWANKAQLGLNIKYRFQIKGNYGA